MKSFADFLNTDERRIALDQDKQIFKSIDGSRYFLSPNDQTFNGCNLIDNILIQPNRTKAFIQHGLIAKLIAVDVERFLCLIAQTVGSTKQSPYDVFARCDLDKMYSIAAAMKQSTKFPIPVINRANNYVDGRHRGLAAFANNALMIPVIVIDNVEQRLASDILQLQPDVKFVNGLILDCNNHLIANIRHCNTIDQAVETIKTSSYNRQPSSIRRSLSEDAVNSQPNSMNTYKTLIDGISAVSNQCFEFSPDKNTRRIICYPDKDNVIEIMLNKTWCDSDIDYNVLVNATIMLGHNYITFANICSLIDAIQQFTFTYDVDRFKLILTDSERSYYQQIALDPAAVEMFITQLFDKFNVLSVERVEQQIVATVNCGQYNLVITIIGNTVKFELIVTNLYIDNIQLTNDNCERFVKDYATMVAKINSDINNCLTYIKQLTRQQKYNSLWLRLSKSENDYTNH